MFLLRKTKINLRGEGHIYYTLKEHQTFPTFARVSKVSDWVFYEKKYFEAWMNNQNTCLKTQLYFVLGRSELLQKRMFSVRMYLQISSTACTWLKRTSFWKIPTYPWSPELTLESQSSHTDAMKPIDSRTVAKVWTSAEVWGSSAARLFTTTACPRDGRSIGYGFVYNEKLPV